MRGTEGGGWGALRKAPTGALRHGARQGHAPSPNRPDFRPRFSHAPNLTFFLALSYITFFCNFRNIFCINIFSVFINILDFHILFFIIYFNFRTHILAGLLSRK